MKLSLSLLLLSLLSLICQAQTVQYFGHEKGGTDGGIVGKSEDEYRITPTGQLSYDIPIPTLPGTGGMKPCLSVSYNSSTKDGLLGYGFDLNGLSVISRTPSDIFHDGKASAISFSDNYHFSLDGQRLIECNSDGGEFKTEINNFAKITNSGFLYNPKSFTVKTKSGLTYEYIPLSEALGSNESENTLFWLVTKVSDTVGNYYIIEYEGNASENDFRVSRISYTGNDNAGLVPYASMRFTYINNDYSPTTYVCGVPVHKSKVMSSVSLYYEEQNVRSFCFEYKTVNRRKLLTSVTEIAADGTYKNPTRFTWATINEFKVKNINYTGTDLIHKAKLTVGDFNGDGMADFLATPQNKKAGWTGWKLFLSNGSGLDFASEGGWYWKDDELENVVSGDFNGDGRDDIIIKRKHSGGYHNCDLYLSVEDNKQTSISYNRCVLSLSINYNIQTVELNGDGAADLFAWYENSKKCELIRSLYDGCTLMPLAETETLICDRKWYHAEFGDFNGDGLTDVMNFDDQGWFLMQTDGIGGLYRKDLAPWPTSEHHIHTGDFNGDGKTDLLLTGYDGDPNKDGWSSWCVFYSLGKGEFKKEYHEKPFDARKEMLYIADINGDGFDDIHAVDKESSGDNMTAPKVYLNDGLGDFYSQIHGCNVYAADKWNFYTGDFNGDGKTDLVCTSNWEKSNWDGYQLLLMPTDVNNLLTGISDGLGNSTDISYTYLSDSNTYFKSLSFEYPLVSVGLSWPVVSVVSEKSSGHVISNYYKYHNAIFHKAGRGMLGFEKVITSKSHTNIFETNTYEINTDKYVIALKSQYVIWQGLKPVSKTDYINTLITQKDCNDVFVFTPTAVRERKYEFNSGEVLSDSYTTTQYDDYGNVTVNTTQTGDVTTVTESKYDNNTSTWQLGRLKTSTVTKSDSKSVVSRTSILEYDSETGLLSSEAFEPENTELGYCKTYTHDKFGNIIESSTAPIDGTAPRTEKTGYDEKGRFLLSTTNSLGFTTIRTIDDVLGVVTKETDENGIITQYRYDSFGQLVHTSTPISETSKATGWASSLSEAPDGAVYFEYSKSTGQPSSAVYYDGYGRTLRTITDAPLRKRVFADIVYNDLGWVTKTSEPYFAGDNILWNTNSYDLVGRITEQAKPDGSTTSFAYNGFSTKVTDALGHFSSKTIDHNGRLVESVDAMGGYIHYKYDVDGNCIRVEGPRTTVVMDYDLAGNRIMLDDSDIGVSYDVYNAFGELVRHEDAHGTTTYEYDLGGRLVQENRPDLSFTTIYDKEWKGAVSAVEANGSSKHYRYDNYGRVLLETTLIGPKQYSVSTTYNSLGLPYKITYPNGLVIQRFYDSHGFLTTVRNGKIIYWSLCATNAHGQVEKEQYGSASDTFTTTMHDPATGNVTAIEMSCGKLLLTYTYDAVGNVKSRYSKSFDTREFFTYDALNRLVRIDCNRAPVVTVSYDHAGNIVRKSDVGNYSYIDETNRLAAISENVKVWDEIRYNSLDKTTFVKSGSDVMSLTYGPDKNRVMVCCNDVKKYYVGGLYEEKCKDGKSLEHVSYIYALDRPIAMVVDTQTDSNTYFFSYDNIGSIVRIINADRSKWQDLDYDAWGRRRDPRTLAYNVWDIKNDHGFTGHEHIDLFDMVNMNGRIYDPVVGRFLTPDPFVQAPNFTQSLNRYAYCLNNPLSLVDPSGYSWISHNWKSIVSATVGIAVGAVTLGTGTTVGIAIAAGAASGAASALTGALLNGSNIGQVAKATFCGGFWGAISGCLNYKSADNDFIVSLFKHAFTQGALEGAQGGNIMHGLYMGAVSALSNKALQSKKMDNASEAVKIAASAILGGSVDEIGGGKFANGATTAAFSMIFNEIMHSKQHVWHRNMKIIFKNYKAIVDNFDAASFYDFLGGPLGDWAKTSPNNFINTCAAKLSYALNYSGYKIKPHTPNTYLAGDGNWYFINAKDMNSYLEQNFIKINEGINRTQVKNAITFQTGFKHGVSGHLDVFYRRKSASGAYYNVPVTIYGK